MQSSNEVQLNRRASLLDGASDSEDEDEQPLQQSQQADDMQQAAEVRTAVVQGCHAGCAACY